MFCSHKINPIFGCECTYSLDEIKQIFEFIESNGEDSLFVANVRYFVVGEKYSVKIARPLCGKVVYDQNIIASVITLPLMTLMLNLF